LKEVTLLHRQIHPSWVHNNRLSSQAFRPAPKDEDLLSMYDGDLIAADRAYLHFTTVFGFTSCGVCSVTVAECAEQGLPARPDPKHFAEHAVVDFKNVGRGEADRKAKALRQKAHDRGWQHRPDVLS
jgi:hypothetical protein